MLQSKRVHFSALSRFFLGVSMARAALRTFVVAVGSLATTTALAQPQVVDPDYDTRVARPAYVTQHPAVLFDEAHYQLPQGGRPVQAIRQSDRQ